MKQIAAAFVKAQKEFAPALKTATNPHFKSKYADLAACIEAVIDALNRNEIALIQQTHPSEDGVTIETMFMHSSGETISGGKLHVPALKQDPPGYGSALTYARRYSLMAACGIAPEDDDGNAAKAPRPRPRLVTVSRSIEELSEFLGKSKTIADLQIAWLQLTKEEQEMCAPIKDGIKANLSAPNRA